MRAFFRLDRESSHEIADRAHLMSTSELKKVEEDIKKMRPYRAIILAKRLLESAKRIAEYSADIAEATINLSIINENHAK